MNNKKKPCPRYLAYKILRIYFSKKIPLKKIIDIEFASSGITGPDRAFAFDIIKGTIRFLLRIDYSISCFSERKTEDIDLCIITVLRTAFYQFMYMDRVPPHAIVNESVALAKKYCSISSSGFVNAILRKISIVNNLNDFTGLKINEKVKDEFKKISLVYSIPVWLVKYFCDMYDKDTLEKIFSKFNEEPAVFIRVNKLKTTRENLVNLFLAQNMAEGRDFISCSKGFLKEEIFTDTLILKKISNIKAIGGYRQGYFSIQDFSSQTAVKYFLKPQKGEKILDLCGAPGGKAAYMSELAQDNCLIVSVDINLDRLRIFSRNIERLGIKNIKLVHGDAALPEVYSKYGFFDKIFIDAPCSAFGTIAKNPDVKYNRNLNDIKRFAKNSLAMLQGCLDYLKPSGIIVFYTCTLSVVENQEVLYEFVKRNSKKCRLLKPEIPAALYDYAPGMAQPNLNSDKQFFEILPYFFGSEGGFAAAIEKL